MNKNAENCEHQIVQEPDTVPVSKSHADKKSTDKSRKPEKQINRAAAGEECDSRQTRNA